MIYVIMNPRDVEQIKEQIKKGLKDPAYFVWVSKKPAPCQVDKCLPCLLPSENLVADWNANRISHGVYDERYREGLGKSGLLELIGLVGIAELKDLYLLSDDEEAPDCSILLSVIVREKWGIVMGYRLTTIEK